MNRSVPRFASPLISVNIHMLWVWVEAAWTGRKLKLASISLPGPDPANPCCTSAPPWQLAHPAGEKRGEAGGAREEGKAELATDPGGHPCGHASGLVISAWLHMHCTTLGRHSSECFPAAAPCVPSNIWNKVMHRLLLTMLPANVQGPTRMVGEAFPTSDAHRQLLGFVCSILCDLVQADCIVLTHTFVQPIAIDDC